MSKETYRTPKGMKDISQEDMCKRKKIFSVIRDVLDSYGYNEVMPTALEHWETLAAKAGEDNLKEVYDFEDKAGRRLALRFDLTCGIARMAASMRTAKPIKLYCIGDVWRYDAPQKGRYRAFTQWDVELFGVDSVSADAEVIAVSSEIFRRLGIDFEVRINNRRLVESVFEYLEIDRSLWEDVMRVVDKIPKLKRSDILDEFGQSGITDKQASDLLEILGRKGSPKDMIKCIKKDYAGHKNIMGSISVLEELLSLLESYGVSERCIFDLSIVRGIGYYNGIVFEAFDRKMPKLGSLFAGGRFDGLVGIYGKEDMPAVGVGGGMERLLDSDAVYIDNVEGLKTVYVASLCKEVIDYAISVSNFLRSKGYSVEMDLSGRPLKKQMDYANKKEFDHVAVIGKDEMDKGCFKLKDMSSGKEEALEMNGLL